jgi:LPXTG-motif cell wall-anchored protein
MPIAMGNALALMRGHELRFLQDFSSRDFTWLLIGVLLAALAMWGYSRRRRSLF